MELSPITSVQTREYQFDELLSQLPINLFQESSNQNNAEIKIQKKHIGESQMTRVSRLVNMVENLIIRPPELIQTFLKKED